MMGSPLGRLGCPAPKAWLHERPWPAKPRAKRDRMKPNAHRKLGDKRPDTGAQREEYSEARLVEIELQGGGEG